jgi:hypothetical protein
MNGGALPDAVAALSCTVNSLAATVTARACWRGHHQAHE